MDENCEHLDFSKLELSVVKNELDKLEDIEKNKFLPENLSISGNGKIDKAFSDNVINYVKDKGYEFEHEKNIRENNPVYWKNQDSSIIIFKGIKYVGDQNA